MKTTLDQWEALHAVVHWGGFGPAAVHLNRSQSTISYAIHRLQEQIGIRVFDLAPQGDPPALPGRQKEFDRSGIPSRKLLNVSRQSTRKGDPRWTNKEA